MDREEWHRRNRAAAAEQAKGERRPSTLLRTGRAGLEPKRGAGAPENKNMGGPEANKSLGGFEFASATAQELAGELFLGPAELGKVEPTGRDGKYTVADVRRAAES